MEKNMATTKAISANATKNDSGVAKNIGTESTTLVTSVLGLDNVATGSVVVDGDDTDKALSAGTFAYNNSAPVAKRLTTSLATVSNTALTSGALVPGLVKSVNKIESIVTRRLATAIRAGYWNIYSGTFSTSPTVATDTFHKAVTGATYIDKVANVSASNPGVAVYKTGAVSPVVNAYGD
jgi:hypothetical protein